MINPALHLLPQWGQRSVALNHYVVARRASTNHGTAAVSSNTETPAKYQLSKAWWNE